MSDTSTRSAGVPGSPVDAGRSPDGGAALAGDEREALADEVEGLRRALETRPLIDLAKGMVMHRYGCGEAAAFGLLRRLSQEHNVKVRDLASAIVARVDDDVVEDGAGVVRDAVAPVVARLFAADPTVQDA